MNIAGILNDAVIGYDGVAIEIYVSGCTRNCKGCHNPEMQSFSYGKPLEHYGILIQYLKDQEKWFDIISILGGDMLEQSEVDAKDLIYVVHSAFPQKKLWLFTGAEYDDIPKWCFKEFDVIKTGTYEESLKQSSGLASSNQKYLRKGVDYL